MKIFSIILFNIISVFSFKQPIPFADVSLSKRSIHKVKIKNDETVAVWWNRKTKEWNAVNNICPHRQASLSDGVINPFTCNIKCRYHGLEFNKNGKCTSIPSSTFGTSIFSVKEYNIKEKYNLLWINDNELDEKMNNFASKLEFEEAAKVRDEINALKAKQVGISKKIIRKKN